MLADTKCDPEVGGKMVKSIKQGVKSIISLSEACPWNKIITLKDHLLASVRSRIVGIFIPKGSKGLQLTLGLGPLRLEFRCRLAIVKSLAVTPHINSGSKTQKEFLFVQDGKLGKRSYTRLELLADGVLDEVGYGGMKIHESAVGER